MPNGDNKLTSKPPAFSLGLTGPLITRGKWGADWHAEYVNLGRAAASCACTPRDENYDANTHHFTNRFDAPAAYFTGSGRSQGVALTIEPYYWAYGVRFGVEAGAYIHRDSWSEDVIGWQVDKAVAPQNLHLSDCLLVRRTCSWCVGRERAIQRGRTTLLHRSELTEPQRATVMERRHDGRAESQVLAASDTMPGYGDQG
jgi:hypothetical protein